MKDQPMPVAMIHRLIPSNYQSIPIRKSTSIKKSVNSFGEDPKSTPDLTIIPHDDVKTAESTVKRFDATPDVPNFYGGAMKEEPNFDAAISVTVFYRGAKKEEPNFDATPDVAVFLWWCYGSRNEL